MVKLKLPVFLLLSTTAMALYFVAGIQFLELTFDHSYRYIGLGLAIFGLSVGVALSSGAEGKGSIAARLLRSPTACVFGAGIAQLLAGFAAHALCHPLCRAMHGPDRSHGRICILFRIRYHTRRTDFSV